MFPTKHQKDTEIKTLRIKRSSLGERAINICCAIVIIVSLAGSCVLWAKIQKQKHPPTVKIEVDRAFKHGDQDYFVVYKTKSGETIGERYSGHYYHPEDEPGIRNWKIRNLGTKWSAPIMVTQSISDVPAGEPMYIILSPRAFGSWSDGILHVHSEEELSANFWSRREWEEYQKRTVTNK